MEVERRARDRAHAPVVERGLSGDGQNAARVLRLDLGRDGAKAADLRVRCRPARERRRRERVDRLRRREQAREPIVRRVWRVWRRLGVLSTAHELDQRLV